MQRILDWIDEFTGHDRQAVRILLVIALGFALLFAADWGYGKLTETGECDATCEEFIRDNAPGVFMSPTPFNPDRFIERVIRE